MRIVLLCATQRGYRCLQRVAELLPDADIVVFSFREEQWEPPFLDDIRRLTHASGGQFFEASRVGGPSFSSFWQSTPIDLMLIVSWRYMIPREVYLRPRFGTFVFHDSLLPAYRGFSPTVWAIANGENHTGATLFAITEDVDGGDIVDQTPVPIGPDDTIADVLERVTQTYLGLISKNVHQLVNGAVRLRPQDHTSATFTCKRTLQDNEINWNARTDNVYNLIRAVTAPYPGAYTHFGGRRLTIWSATRVLNARNYVGRTPGRVVEVRPGEGSVVLTGDGCLLVTRIQVEGEQLMCAADLLNSMSGTLG
jgi:methionyl-tRNA formyltransferase